MDWQHEYVPGNVRAACSVCGCARRFPDNLTLCDDQLFRCEKCMEITPRSRDKTISAFRARSAEKERSIGLRPFWDPGPEADDILLVVDTLLQTSVGSSLASYNSANLIDGQPIWVRSLLLQYRLRSPSTLTINNTTVLQARNLTTGRWVAESGNGTSFQVVATTASLTGDASALANDHTIWFVTGTGHFYRLTANTGHAADSQTIFDTTDGKQWVII